MVVWVHVKVLRRRSEGVDSDVMCSFFFLLLVGLTGKGLNCSMFVKYISIQCGTDPRLESGGFLVDIASDDQEGIRTEMDRLQF